MRNTKMSMISSGRTMNRTAGKLVERPNSYYYFVKEIVEKDWFLRIQTNEELTNAWLGTAAIHSLSRKRVWI